MAGFVPVLERGCEFSMSERRVYVRVSKSDDGVNRELIVDGVKVADISFFEAIGLAMQIVSTLRWEKQ